MFKSCSQDRKSKRNRCFARFSAESPDTSRAHNRIVTLRSKILIKAGLYDKFRDKMEMGFRVPSLSRQSFPMCNFHNNPESSPNIMIIFLSLRDIISKFFLFIQNMFRWFVKQYPKASDIHENTSPQIAYNFLPYTPRLEFEKLDLGQIKFLEKVGRKMPLLDSWARSSDTAQYLLVMRRRQILQQDQMRKNGIQPEPKMEEVSLFDKITQKVASFFKTSKENNYSLIGDDPRTTQLQFDQ